MKRTFSEDNIKLESTLSPSKKQKDLIVNDRVSHFVLQENLDISSRIESNKSVQNLLNMDLKEYMQTYSSPKKIIIWKKSPSQIYQGKMEHFKQNKILASQSPNVENFIERIKELEEENKLLHYSNYKLNKHMIRMADLLKKKNDKFKDKKIEYLEEIGRAHV